MTLPVVAYVPLVGLVVLPAVVLLRYRRGELSRWRFALATSVWFVLLSSGTSTVLDLTGNGRGPADSTLWPALAIGSALAGIGAMGVSVWFWRRRERSSGRPVGDSA